MKCSTYASDSDECSAHFIWTVVLRELVDKLFTRLYEDNVSGKISDERFAQISANYGGEQRQLKQTVSELKAFIEATEQKTADVSNFIQLVRKYTYINELTPEKMHELVEKIVVHAPDKSSGHREQGV